MNENDIKADLLLNEVFAIAAKRKMEHGPEGEDDRLLSFEYSSNYALGTAKIIFEYNKVEIQKESRGE